MQSAQATRPQRKAAKKTSAANAAAASSATEDSGVLEDFDQNSSGAEEQVGHEYDHDGNEKEDDSSRESSRSAPKNAERTLSERTRRRRDINRENARKSRMRKREKQMRLQVQNERLQHENARLTQALVSILQCLPKQQLQATGAPVSQEVTEENVQQWIQQGGMPGYQQFREQLLSSEAGKSQTDSESKESNSGVNAVKRSETSYSSNGSDPQSMRSSSYGTAQSASAGGNTPYDQEYSASKRRKNKRSRSSTSGKGTNKESIQKEQKSSFDFGNDEFPSFPDLPESEHGGAFDLPASDKSTRELDQPTCSVEDQTDIDDFLFEKGKEVGDDYSLHPVSSLNPFDSSPSLSAQDDNRKQLGQVGIDDSNDVNDDGLPFLPLDNVLSS
eukprot:gb/GECG01015036.1/.p1 GENE.gb/GECG01015036.1/~~gb/GECG01015036.1/.p1  ORF type:complete len:388 (+),score=89.48 gb/GECG01015036.1/:1-1164(+)